VRSAASKVDVNVTVLGASGFVGKHLVAALRARGDQVRTASLRDPGVAAAACAGAGAVVNLAGENVAQRWTPAVKERIRSSRVDAPRALLQALAKLDDPPNAYVSASAIGYYGTSEDDTFDETSGPGRDFLAGVCAEWEAEAQRAEAFGARVALVRTGLALGTDGGALAKLLPLFKLGAGGVVASGRQWYSWIHIADLVGIYLAAIDGFAGALDGTAPNPVRNAEFTTSFARALHRPAFFPVPGFALQLVLGEGALVVAEGQRVLPARTTSLGYRFRFATIDEAFTDLFARAS
jgi:uncharacterized protein (TIGR01777 family)